MSDKKNIDFSAFDNAIKVDDKIDFSSFDDTIKKKRQQHNLRWRCFNIFGYRICIARNRRV